MRLSDGVHQSIDGPPAGRAAMPGWLRMWRRRRPHAGIVFALAAAALAGCGLGESPGPSLAVDPGQLIVDPGRYNAYHCKDLAARWKVLLARENELRGLMERASEGGGGGAVIGALAYRADYETVLSEEKLLQQKSVEKDCGILPATLQSDQVIR